MARIRLILTAIALLAIWQAPTYGDEALGRLFLTPERREILDRQRALDTLESQTANEEPEIRVNGLVSRSSGKRTTWINGQAQNDEETRTGVIARPDNQGAGRILIESSEDPRTSVKVGESLNRGTQETVSPLGDGQIIVHRRNSPR